MSDEQTPEWVKQLDGGVVGKDIPGAGLVYGMTIKVEFTGVLAILRVKGGGGYVVSFVGARDFKSLAKKLQPVLTGEAGAWREDKYA
jgi:hypothetical protein